MRKLLSSNSQAHNFHITLMMMMVLVTICFASYNLNIASQKIVYYHVNVKIFGHDQMWPLIKYLGIYMY